MWQMCSACKAGWSASPALTHCPTCNSIAVQPVSIGSNLPLPPSALPPTISPDSIAHAILEAQERNSANVTADETGVVGSVKVGVDTGHAELEAGAAVKRTWREKAWSWLATVGVKW